MDRLATGDGPAHISLLLPHYNDTSPDLGRWPGVDNLWLTLPLLSKNWQKLWWEQYMVPKAARRLQADVLWVPYWAAPLWQPCPVVVTVHDLIPRLAPAYRGGFLQRVYTAFVAYTARRSARILTVSQASARDIVTYLRVPAGHVQVVYHGPNREGQTPPDAGQLTAVRQKYALPDQFFLYLGGFDSRKNVRATLFAYRRYLDRGGDPGVRMVIAGKLPDKDTAFAPDPRRIVAEYSLGTQVHFCDWVDEEDKLALYKLATAYIFPSLYEGFGMMVLEAMMAGTPVVTSATSGLKDTEGYGIT